MSELTRQDELWPSGHNHEFNIKNEILANCIGIGSGSCKGISGFNYGKGLGSALLGYFSARALGFSRLPFFEDRIYAHYMNQRDSVLEELWSKLTIETVEEISAELGQLYSHTQKRLKEAGLEKVRLKRNIRMSTSHVHEYINSVQSDYAGGIIELVEATRVLGSETVKIELDTLNSFTDSRGEYSHLGDVVLEYDFNLEDVLYCSNLVTYSGSSNLVESHEWVLVNRSPTGVVELPVSAFQYDEKNLTAKNQMTKEKAQRFLESHSPFVLRGIDYSPPSYGNYGRSYNLKKRLSRWLMRDNVAGY